MTATATTTSTSASRTKATGFMAPMMAKGCDGVRGSTSRGTSGEADSCREPGHVRPRRPDEGLDDGGLPTFTRRGAAPTPSTGTLRRSFTDGVWVRGEIQGWNERNGHAYFQLADTTAEGRRATLSVSFFANNRMRLRPMLQKSRLRLADGLKVRIHGYLDFYAPNGRLGLKMGGIDPRYTLGEMSLQRDEVVRRLVATGLFDRNRALAFPAVPLRVGVVTSVGSAAWHDFTHELERSGSASPACHRRQRAGRVGGGDGVAGDRRPRVTRRPRRAGRHPRRRFAHGPVRLRHRRGRAGASPAPDCRCSPDWVTRSTARWPTRSPTSR